MYPPLVLNYILRLTFLLATHIWKLLCAETIFQYSLYLKLYPNSPSEYYNLFPSIKAKTGWGWRSGSAVKSTAPAEDHSSVPSIHTGG